MSLLALAPLASAGDDALLLPKAEIPEERLVDVAIDLFSPGVSDAPPSPLLEKGIRSAVRKSEARYIPIHLRNTLQSTGQWGAVRVVPGGAAWAELLVTGEIEKSNGKDLVARISARDAAGRVWADRYKQRADTTAYAKDRPVDGRDAFQALYNRVANDLVRARDKRKPRELAEVREVARLRFAASMAHDPYAAYLAVEKKGRARVERLPAADDPMIARISAIRDRDHMFVDTLNEYYADFYARMDRPYDDWRAYSYTEQVALDSINRASLWKKIGGAIAVVAGVVMSQGDNTPAASRISWSSAASPRCKAGSRTPRRGGSTRRPSPSSRTRSRAMSRRSSWTWTGRSCSSPGPRRRSSRSGVSSCWRSPRRTSLFPPTSTSSPRRRRRSRSPERLLPPMSLPAPGLEILPGLTLLRPLGRGGMGEAWLARDAGRGEEVVAKVVPADAPPERVALLRREARLVRKLTHPRIVPVYGFRTGERGSAVTQRYMPGATRGGSAGRRRSRWCGSAATWPRRSSTSTASGSSTAT